MAWWQNILNFIIGAGVTALGVYMVINTEWFLGVLGSLQWFEEKLGSSGGSRFGYKLIGIFLAFIGILIAFGMLSGFAEFVLSPLTKVIKTGQQYE